MQTPTIDGQIRARSTDDNVAILFEGEDGEVRSWTYREYVQCCAERAALLLARRSAGPLHVGLLLDNVPEFPMWLGAAALTGGAIVGVNPTRRGADLARDIRHTDCQLVVTEPKYESLLRGLDIGLAPENVLVTGSEGYASALAPQRGAALPDEASVKVDPAGIYLLLFTSGTTGAPKAVICSQARLAVIGQHLSARYSLSSSQVCYQVMPLFHSNALMAGWAPALAGGAVSALRRKFSASGFLPDVRRFGATYFNYVGKPLSYILTTPELPDDADNPLVHVFGNEGAEKDLARFAKRFGCSVVDGYGSSEGAAGVGRTPDTPAGSLGRADDNHVILDSDTGEPCPPARFDAQGRLLNAEEAIGELVNRGGGARFEGYYKNPEAMAARIRDGAYWTGDLMYRDEAGFFYFAGRSSDWLRVDGENFAGAPVERILERHPDVVLAAVYAVPDVAVGDQAMAALLLKPDARFDPAGFARFLEEQSDLGTKWAPRYVRVASELPITQSNKILKRQLQSECWECDDPVFVANPEKGYVPLTPEDARDLRQEFETRGRAHLLDL